MKLTKTQWILVAVVALAIWYFFLRKKDEGTKKENGYYMYNPNEDSLNSPYFDAYGSDGTESSFEIMPENAIRQQPCDILQNGMISINNIKSRFKEINHLYRPINGKDTLKTDRDGITRKYFTVKYKLINENISDYKPLPYGYISPSNSLIYTYRYDMAGAERLIKKIKLCIKK
jgi:hypothetical protein